MQEETTELYKWYIIHTHSGFEAKVINNSTNDYVYKIPNQIPKNFRFNIVKIPKFTVVF